MAWAADITWFKGNLHTHSFWSDGHDFPEMIADWFRRQGYHFLAFTEHDRLQEGDAWVPCDPQTSQGRSILDGRLLERYRGRFGPRWVEVRGTGACEQVRLKPMSEYRHLVEEPGRFLLLAGEEISARWGGGTYDETNYINAINPPRVIEPWPPAATSREAIQETINAGDALGRLLRTPVLMSLNHPNWRWNATAEDISAVTGLRFMEVHVALSSCRNAGDTLHAPVERIWDIVLTKRIAEMNAGPVFGLASDDSHAYQAGHHELGDRALPGRAWIMVRAASLAPEALLRAMDAGHFYATTGVVLEDIQADSSGIQLFIRPDPKVQYITRFIGTRRGCDLSSEPVRNQAGDTIRATRRYSADLGQTLYETSELQPRYAFRGDELYVRAVINSSAEHPNPDRPGARCMAWTQPILLPG